MKNKKQTQQEKIISALIKYRHSGLTTFGLIVESGSTCPHKRCAEIGYGDTFLWGRNNVAYQLQRDWVYINRRRVRLYRLVRV